MNRTPAVGAGHPDDIEQLDDMIEAVARSTKLSSEQASAAVVAMFRFMAGRLPSPLFGEIQSHLHATAKDDRHRADGR